MAYLIKNVEMCY